MDWKQINNSLNLIQSYYRFLYLWLFLEDIIKENDISQFAKDVNIKTWENTSFKLKQQTIQSLLKEIYNNPDKQNIFWYFTQLTMFRWISATMKELVEEENNFKSFLQSSLKSKYFDFEQIIRFIRNILSHNIDTNIIIKQQDYASQKIYLLSRWKHIVNFNFRYKKIFWQYWTWDPKYWINMKINFKKISHNDKFFNIISLHDLFLLSELCYNLVQIYKHKKKKA